jgi:hypothetical protein
MRSSAYSRLRGVRNDQGSINLHIDLADCLSLSLLERKKKLLTHSVQFNLLYIAAEASLFDPR